VLWRAVYSEQLLCSSKNGKHCSEPETLFKRAGRPCSLIQTDPLLSSMKFSFPFPYLMFIFRSGYSQRTLLNATPCTAVQLEDYSLSAVRDCLCIVFARTAPRPPIQYKTKVCGLHFDCLALPCVLPSQSTPGYIEDGGHAVAASRKVAGSRFHEVN
jgi:hypothetical protein